MKPNDLPLAEFAEATQAWRSSDPSQATALSPLASAPSDSAGFEPINGTVFGELLALEDEHATALVRYAGQRGAQAIRARTTIALDGRDIGRTVLLSFEHGNPTKPIVMGLLRGEELPLPGRNDHVQLEVDGERTVISARHQLVLRCGKASITLTRSGKVLVRGVHVSTISEGVNRVSGASVQLN
jgi:hypothetical protein